MTTGSGRGRPDDFFSDFLDDIILAHVLPARDAAKMKPEELDVIRANMRSELLYSDSIRNLLVKRGSTVLSELRG